MDVLILLPSRKDNFISFNVLSRNKIKYLKSLSSRKYRNLHGQYIAEGEKMVHDLLEDIRIPVRMLVATKGWLTAHPLHPFRVDEVLEAGDIDMGRISTLETPAPVLAVLDIPVATLNHSDVFQSLSLVLDNIQDPGNLGTIIRIASWFGIPRILCSEACVDCYNPKVVQASMGSLLHVQVHYTDLPAILSHLPDDPSFPVYGTFMEGRPVSELPATRKGIVVFGNEARGISSSLFPYIQTRITIPPGQGLKRHVESLNVASAVAVIAARLTRPELS
jgi:TrmH family RNA methyltransferase